MIYPHNTDVKFSFYNDRVKEIVDANLIAEPFTYVPIRAGHLELVGGNAVVFGKITEGYDVISPAISTEIDFESTTYYGEAIGADNVYPKIDLSPYPQRMIAVEYVNYPDNYLSGYEYHKGEEVRYDYFVWEARTTTKGNTPAIGSIYWKSLWYIPYSPPTLFRKINGVLAIYIPNEIYVGSYYYITIKNVEEGISSFTVRYLAQTGDTNIEVIAGLKAALLATGLSADEIVTVAGTVAYSPFLYLFERTRYYRESPIYEAGDINTVFKDFEVTSYILSLGYTHKFPNLKCGATHGYGIVYKDRASRLCSVIKTADTTVYIPFYSEDENNLIESIVKLKFKILNNPPDWAETYEIVYFGNLSLNYFLQIRADSINAVPLSSNTRFALSVANTITWTREKNNRWKVSDYTWQSGDRVRLIGTIDVSTNVVTKYDILYDYEIEETANQSDDTIGGDWLIFQAIEHPSDFELGETTITTLTVDLTGTVTTLLANSSTTKRTDKITLAGTGGTASIRVGNLTKTATYNASLTQTATDFVADFADSWLDIGIVLTSDGEDLTFESSVEGVDFPGASNILVEIYRPRKGLIGSIAYGTGMVFDIGTDIYGHKYHKGDVDQLLDPNGYSVSAAEVENTANDCWKFERLNYEHNTGNVNVFWADSIFPSDWWGGQIVENILTSKGFPFLDDLSQRQQVLKQRGRHGGFLITGTRTNNIAHFTYDDFFDLAEKDGEITGLREVGYTLKVIQKYKETSIYINRIQTFNPDGTEQFTLTDKFMGTMRPMENDYGSQHPNSIIVNGRNIYYWDNSQGEFIRSAPNGQLALSSPPYKMSHWFKELVRWIQTSGGAELLEVNVGANNEHEEIWTTFRMGDEIKGVIFSEKRGRFVSRLNQITESYVHLGNFFAHLYHQRLWIMNIDEGQDYLTWVGVPTFAEVEVVSNIEPVRNKVYKAVALFADHQLQSLPQSVYIPDEGSADDNLMETNIPIWDHREGVFFGEIMKDINSKGNFISLYDRKMNGNTLRGRYCYVKLTTEEHSEKVRIDSIVIMTTLSERNV